MRRSAFRSSSRTASRPGPVLALVAGAHGTEYSSIIALERVIERLDPAALSGTVIVVPLVNPRSFEQKIAHVNPVDNKSMNRFYPGRMDGTQTERASYLITKEVVERCDHLIDLHGGDLDESLRPYSYWTVSGNAPQDAISRQMVLAFGVSITSSSRPTGRKIPPRRAISRTPPPRAANRPSPSKPVTPERRRPTTSKLLANGCFNVMRFLKMLPGEVKPIENPVWVRIDPERDQRSDRHLLSARPPRDLRRTRHEDRLRHRLHRPHDRRCPRAGCGHRDVHSRRSVDDERGDHREYWGGGEAGAGELAIIRKWSIYLDFTSIYRLEKMRISSSLG